MTREAELAFGGLRPLPPSRRCPICGQGVDVRAYPALGQAYWDCWPCRITWETSWPVDVGRG